MRNYWLEEVRIKDAINLLSTLLNAEFKCTLPEPKEWLVLIEELIDTLYSGDIVVLDGLMRYEIECTVDDMGLVDQIMFVEKKS